MGKQESMHTNWELEFGGEGDTRFETIESLAFGVTAPITEEQIWR